MFTSPYDLNWCWDVIPPRQTFQFIQFLFRNFGISIRRQYSDISDDQLDVKVREITQDNQFLGQRLVQGMLAAEGIKVQRQRVADSLIRVDEAAVAMRWCRAIHRRVYQVAGPNALWHIDGNHKLIRYIQLFN